MTDLLTAAELAERLRVKTGTVSEWVRRGVIPAIRINPKVIRFDFDAVVSALKDGDKPKAEAVPHAR